MPAINPARLKIQVKELVEQYEDSAKFLRALHNLLDFYADRTRRAGQSGRRASLLRAYQVPRQVLRQIEKDLLASTYSDDLDIIPLIDALWLEPWLECRLLAITLLERIPPEHPDAVLERIRQWGSECRDEQLIIALLDVGASYLGVKASEQFLILVEAWLTSAELALQKLGLRAVQRLIQEPEFENLPLFYRLLTPLVREPDSYIETSLLDVLSALAQRSPQEALYFIRQNLSASRHPGLVWLARNTLDHFPSEQQTALRALLRERT